MRLCDIITKADNVVGMYGTNNPYKIAKELDIDITERDFKVQKGVYKVILNNRFIFIKADLDPVMKNIVIAHEIGHDLLHRDEAISNGGFKDFNIFNMQNIRMEYEANVFASHLLLPNADVLEYVSMGYDVRQIASAMNTDENLVAIKIKTLIEQGHKFNAIEHKKNFLKG